MFDAFADKIFLKLLKIRAKKIRGRANHTAHNYHFRRPTPQTH